MSWQFTENCLNGYPSHAGLNDICTDKTAVAPFPKAIMVTSHDYPKIKSLRKIRSKTAYPPYPLWIFRCLNESINNGYPTLIALEHLKTDFYSRLFINEKCGQQLYLDNTMLEAAYFDNQKIYNTFLSGG